MLLSEKYVRIYVSSAELFTQAIAPMFICAQVFKELFDVVINERHLGFGPDAKHPAPDLDASKVLPQQSLSFVFRESHSLYLEFSYHDYGCTRELNHSEFVNIVLPPIIESRV